MSTLGGRERGEQSALDVIDDRIECRQLSSATVGDGDHVAASVRRIDGPLDQSSVFQVGHRERDLAVVRYLESALGVDAQQFGRAMFEAGSDVSEASAEPRRSTRAFSTASRTESTRLIWPAPMPTVAPSLA